MRIVLERVYGIRSSTYHEEPGYPVDEDYASFPVVKTHLLPDQLVPSDPNIPAIYLLRDGRDCAVSLAHYRRRLIAPDSDFAENLRAVIDAAEGSHFGGWSDHVRAWSERAGLVIRFEELIVDPIGCCERLRPWLALPEPRRDRLPTFTELQERPQPYGSGAEHGFDETAQARLRTAKFRRGQVGAWRDELPEAAHLRFLRVHGRQLVRTGYITRDTVDRARANHALHLQRSVWRRPPERRQREILIDATKLADTTSDGIRRYTQGLLVGLLGLARDCAADFKLIARLRDGVSCNLLEMEDVGAIERLALMEPPGMRSWVRGRLPRRALSRLSTTVRWASNKLITPAKEPPPALVHVTLPNTWSAYEGIDALRVTTVHDCSHLRCPEMQTISNVETLRDGLRAAERNASHYIAVSHLTRNELVELCDVRPERISVTYSGCDTSLFRPDPPLNELERVRQAYRLPSGPYLLALSTFEPRKNLVGLVRAFKRCLERNPRLELSLVLAGSPGWGDPEPLRRETLGCARIRVLGRVEECDLAVLYSGAQAFCYVSAYEGFGLPALEAMSCGVPVVYGRGTAVEEVVAETGLSAEPRDEERVAAQIERLATDPDLRRELARAAVLRSLDFDWGTVASSTLDVYERCLTRAMAGPRHGVAAARVQRIHGSWTA